MARDGEEAEMKEEMQPLGMSLDDYEGVMLKANKCPNKHKKRSDIAKAKKLKAKVQDFDFS